MAKQRFNATTHHPQVRPLSTCDSLQDDSDSAAASGRLSSTRNEQLVDVCVEFVIPTAGPRVGLSRQYGEARCLVRDDYVVVLNGAQVLRP